MLKKYVLQCKKCTALVIFGRILEHNIFYTGIVERSRAKQNGCSWFGGGHFGKVDTRVLSGSFGYSTVPGPVWVRYENLVWRRSADEPVSSHFFSGERGHRRALDPRGKRKVIRMCQPGMIRREALFQPWTRGFLRSYPLEDASSEYGNKRGATNTSVVVRSNVGLAEKRAATTSKCSARGRLTAIEKKKPEIVATRRGVSEASSPPLWKASGVPPLVLSQAYVSEDDRGTGSKIRELRSRRSRTWEHFGFRPGRGLHSKRSLAGRSKESARFFFFFNHRQNKLARHHFAIQVPLQTPGASLAVLLFCFRPI